MADNKIKGLLSGYLSINNRDLGKNKIDIILTDFDYMQMVQADLMQLKSKDITDSIENYNFYVDQLVFNKVEVESLAIDLSYNKEKNTHEITNSSMQYLGKNYNGFLLGEYNYKDKWLDMGFEFSDASLNIFSGASAYIESLYNTGYVKWKLVGPIHNLSVRSLDVDFNDFELRVVSSNDGQSSVIQVPRYRYRVDSSVLSLDVLNVIWQGDHTFRRVTRENKKNEFNISGDIDLGPIDLMKKKAKVAYNLTMKDTFFSMNFPVFFSGDILANQIKFQGDQTLYWDKNALENIKYSLGKANESGPQLSGSLIFRDGIFNLPKRTKNKTKPRILLDLTTTLGSGNYIQGSLVGDGIFRFANNIFLELDEKNRSAPFQISGSINSPQFTTSLYFYDGSISIFDGVYELMPKSQQNHFFKDVPEYVTDQRVDLSPIQDDGFQQMMVALNLRALRK